MWAIRIFHPGPENQTRDVCVAAQDDNRLATEAVIVNVFYFVQFIVYRYVMSIEYSILFPKFYVYVFFYRDFFQQSCFHVVKYVVSILKAVMNNTVGHYCRGEK